MAKGIIKIGSSLVHDHACFKWPSCKPPMKEYEGEEYIRKAKDPYMTFDVIYNTIADTWTCRADGYGMESRYGNGAITVYERDSICLL